MTTFVSASEEFRVQVAQGPQIPASSAESQTLSASIGEGNKPDLPSRNSASRPYTEMVLRRNQREQSIMKWLKPSRSGGS